MMSNQYLKTRQHCVFSLTYHLVMVTKYRRKCLTDTMLTTIGGLIADRASSWGGELLEVNGESDHVHCLLSLPPHKPVADFVNAVKTNTSRLLRRDFAEHLARFYTEPVLWSRSYCVLSVGGAPLEVLKRYIEQQERPD